MQKSIAFAKGICYPLGKVFSKLNWLFLMRLSVCCGAILIVSASLFASSNIKGQSLTEMKIKIQVYGQSLETALLKVGEQSGFSIFYSTSKLAGFGNISLTAKNISVADALAQLLSGTNLDYRQVGSKIIISDKKERDKESTNMSKRLFGIVVDEEDKPLPGVTVRLKLDKSTSTATDANGQFHIDIAKDEDIVIYSFVGFQTQEIKASDVATSVKVVMKATSGSLNEVVVIGYGTSTRKDLIGAVSSITAADIAKQPVQNPLNALQGRIAGAVITQSNGLPGSAVNILIRGQNSLEAGVVPLYVIDGVPFNINDGTSPASNQLNSRGIFGANRGLSPFSIINPNDIDRIDILKDADATAIYGARGGNGVVLITTKKGKAGKTKVDINLYQGVGKVARFIPMLNTQQYLKLRKQADFNDGLTPDPSTDPDLLAWDTTKTTNWQQKYLGGTAHITDAQASISGGNEGTRFIFTNGFHRESTVYPGNYNDQKYTSRFNLVHISTDKKFNMNLSVNYSYNYSLLPPADLSSTFNLPPNYPLYNPNGTLYWDDGGIITNPQSYFLQTNTNRNNSLISNLQLNYTLIDGLDLKLNAGYNNIGLTQVLQTPVLSQSPVFTTPVNAATFGNSKQIFYSVEPQIAYNRNIGKGKLSLLAGGTLQRSAFESVKTLATGYANPDLLSTANGAASYNVTATGVLYKFSSLFGRATYNWDGKYIINGTLRRDGSSRFGSDHPFGTFYSVGGAWIFNREQFFKNNLAFLSFGKLKASYGLTGNDQIGDYLYLPTYSSATGSSSYQGSSTLFVSRIPNPELQWESDRKLDFGLELGFFKDRILLSADYYRNRSSNQLGFLNLAIQSGKNSYAGNLPALLQNRGFEFEVNTVNVRAKNFTWRTSLNLTIPRSELLAVSPNYFYADSYVLGYPITQQKVYNYSGVDAATGLPSFKSASGAITTNPDYSTDRTLIEDTSPKLYGGISNNFTYGNWGFSFFIQYTKQTGIIYPGETPGSISSGNGYASQADLWTGPGSTARYPLASTDPYLYTFTYGQSNAVFGDNSFAKLRNVSLSYKLPDAWTKRLGMNQFKIYAQGQNSYTWTKNKIGYDPETGTAMPPLRMMTIGLNVTF